MHLWMTEYCSKLLHEMIRSNIRSINANKIEIDQIYCWPRNSFDTLALKMAKIDIKIGGKQSK